MNDYDVAKRFSELKAKCECDDATAAMLVLAESISEAADNLPRNIEYMLERTSVRLDGGLDIVRYDPPDDA